MKQFKITLLILLILKGLVSFAQQKPYYFEAPKLVKPTNEVRVTISTQPSQFLFGNFPIFLESKVFGSVTINAGYGILPLKKYLFFAMPPEEGIYKNFMSNKMGYTLEFGIKDWFEDPSNGPFRGFSYKSWNFENDKFNDFLFLIGGQGFIKNKILIGGSAGVGVRFRDKNNLSLYLADNHNNGILFKLNFYLGFKLL